MFVLPKLSAFSQACSLFLQQLEYMNKLDFFYQPNGKFGFENW